MRLDPEDRPRDPNHENVITISSEGESDGNQYDMDEDDDDEILDERSTYFPPPEVQAFNQMGMVV